MASELMSSSLMSSSLMESMPEGFFHPKVSSAQGYMQQHCPGTSSQDPLRESHQSFDMHGAYSLWSEGFVAVPPADFGSLNCNDIWMNHWHREEADYDHALCRNNPFNLPQTLRNIWVQDFGISSVKLESSLIAEENAAESKYRLAGLRQLGHANLGLVCAAGNNGSLLLDNSSLWKPLLNREDDAHAFRKLVPETEDSKQQYKSRAFEKHCDQDHMGSRSSSSKRNNTIQDYMGSGPSSNKAKNAFQGLGIHQQKDRKSRTPGPAGSSKMYERGSSVTKLTYAMSLSEENNNFLPSVHTVTGINEKKPSNLERTCNHEDNDTQKIVTEKASEGPLHPAISFVFSYLGLRDLLALERVCKSLRTEVKDEAFLWTSLHVDHPLSKKLTDDALIQLSARAQGNLQYLGLVECVKVTDMGLKLVLQSNPNLTKLCLPRCTRISPEGLVKMVKELKDRNSVATSELKHLRINGLYGLAKDHVESLKIILSVNSKEKSENTKPQFYNVRRFFSSYDDERSLDVDVCPICETAMLIYDCPRESCQEKKNTNGVQCRGCLYCIPRCGECGCCIVDNRFEETFYLDRLCLDCCNKLPKCLACNKPGCEKHTDIFFRRTDTSVMCGNCRGVYYQR